MKAIYIQRHGAVGDLTVSDVAVPSISAGEVLVRVEASGINPSDVVSVEGRFPGSVLPRIVGRDFAGTVVQGPRDMVGMKVWGSGGDLGISRNGTHAGYVAIPQGALAQRPKNLSAEESSAVGVPFITAFSATVSLGSVNRGDWVIVSGAAGAVGQAAIQIVHAKGAQVVALVKNATHSWVSQSVEAIAESERGNLEAVVREVTNGKGADLALNGVGGSVFGAIQSALGIGGFSIRRREDEIQRSIFSRFTKSSPFCLVSTRRNSMRPTAPAS